MITDLDPYSAAPDFGLPTSPLVLEWWKLKIKWAHLSLHKMLLDQAANSLGFLLHSPAFAAATQSAKVASVDTARRLSLKVSQI